MNLIIDYKLLSEQKLELVKLSMGEHLLTPAQYDALNGIINFIDAVEDEAAQQTEVYNLKTYRE